MIHNFCTCNSQMCKTCILQNIEDLKKPIKEYPDDVKSKQILQNLEKRYKNIYVIGKTNYIIDKQIGSGEDGIIYIVKDKDGKEYIIKKIFKETNERKTLEDIEKCDNVNKILGYSKEYLAILLDYVNGIINSRTIVRIKFLAFN